MMFNFLVLLIAGLFFLIGVYFLVVKEFKEPTVWKFYFPPFYEKTSETNKLIIYRKLKMGVKIVLGWYFIIVGAFMLSLLIAVNLQCSVLTR